MAIVQDIRILLFFNGFTTFVMFICLLHVALRRRTSPGFNLWIWASLAYSAGYVLASLDRTLPDAVTVIIAVSLTVLAAQLVCRGLALFCGRNQPILLDLAVPVAFAAYLFFLEPSIHVRIVIVSIVMGLIYLRATLLVLGPVARFLGEKNILLLESFGLISLFALLRAFTTLIWGNTHLADIGSAGPYHGLVFLALIAVHIIMMMGLISINSKRLENDLTTALHEIKTLRGIIPICTTCKKIRDDQGYWQQVESYVHAHTHAEFTHSICPDCLKTLYPELEINKKQASSGDVSSS